MPRHTCLPSGLRVILPDRRCLPENPRTSRSKPLGSTSVPTLISWRYLGGGRLEDQVLAMLLEIANKCPVHRTPISEINIRTRLLRWLKKVLGLSAAPPGVLPVTRRFKSLSATKSLRFRFCGVGKGTLGIDSPSLVVIPLRRKLWRHVPDPQAALLRVLPAMCVLRLDLPWPPALASVGHRMLVARRVRFLVTQSPEVQPGTSRVQFRLRKGAAVAVATP
jgi:hypothetical protein